MRDLRFDIRKLMDDLRARLGGHTPWYDELCEYYSIGPAAAYELGTRRTGRRPSLPASKTTHEVRDKTLEDLWEDRTREAPADVQAFYDEVGAWFSFRQTYYHRNSKFPDVWAHVTHGTRICEYGAGVAPVTYGYVRAHPKTAAHHTIVDVPSEHLRFGEWRLRRLLERTGSGARVEALHVLPDGLPLQDTIDLITILEVLEHVHNPLEVVIHLVDHLSVDGLLWENFVAGEPGAENLPEAQEQRADVYRFLETHLVQLSGKPAESPGGGGTRCWRKRPIA